MSDTVRVIGLHAKKRSGKDTLSQRIRECWGFSQVAFAEPLYKGLHAMFPFIRDECWVDRDLPIPELGRSVNELLQSLGTDWGRNMIHERVWIDRAAEAGEKRRADCYGAGIVFSDVRFENEARYIVEERKGYIIEIVSDRSYNANLHVSNNRLPDKYIHARIENNTSIHDMWVEFQAAMQGT